MNTLERILELKQKRGLSDLALERELKLKSRTVSSWKLNRSKTYMDIIPQIANYFGVSTDYLLTGSEKPDTIDDEAWELANKIFNLPEPQRDHVQNLVALLIEQSKK